MLNMRLGLVLDILQPIKKARMLRLFSAIFGGQYDNLQHLLKNQYFYISNTSE